MSKRDHKKYDDKYSEHSKQTSLGYHEDHSKSKEKKKMHHSRKNRYSSSKSSSSSRSRSRSRSTSRRNHRRRSSSRSRSIPDRRSPVKSSQGYHQQKQDHRGKNKGRNYDGNQRVDKDKMFYDSSTYKPKNEESNCIILNSIPESTNKETV